MVNISGSIKLIKWFLHNLLVKEYETLKLSVMEAVCNFTQFSVDIFEGMTNVLLNHNGFIMSVAYKFYSQVTYLIYLLQGDICSNKKLEDNIYSSKMSLILLSF